MVVLRLVVTQLVDLDLALRVQSCCVLLCHLFFFFFFKQKTAYEMRISDWSSDVCSSDLSSLLRETRLRTATVTRCCSSLLASEGVKRKPLALRPLRASAAASLGSAEAGVNDPMPSSMPIVSGRDGARRSGAPSAGDTAMPAATSADRKSTGLNSSH